MTKQMTINQIQKKYSGKYVEVYRTYDYGNGRNMYEVRRVYSTIHENSTRPEDLETENAYRR